ncbi:hypothetical protein CSB69_2306 [Morganella morganii]|nr:hypothetical protein CSB69_2306 [Morganella morganii]
MHIALLCPAIQLKIAGLRGKPPQTDPKYPPELNTGFHG